MNENSSAKPGINTRAIKGFFTNFIVPISALVATLGLGILYIYPSFNKIPEFRATLGDKQALVSQLEEKIRKMNTLLDFEDSVHENLLLVSDALSSESAVPQLLTQIDLIAQGSGLEVNKLGYSVGTTASTPSQPGSVPTGLKHQEVIINLGVKGTYEQLVTFLASLENSARVINVTTLRYTLDVVDETTVDAALVLHSPYVEIQTTAVTDDPIEFDITDSIFQGLLAQLKELKVYRISIDKVIDIENLPSGEDAGTESIPSEGAIEDDSLGANESPTIPEGAIDF